MFDFFERIPGWDAQPERFRLHAVATQAAADRVARELDYPERDQLLTSALLHDIGKLVLVHAYPAYPHQIHGDARTPEERVHARAPRARRRPRAWSAASGPPLGPAPAWRPPSSATTPTTPTGEAAIVRLADMLAHYGQGGAVDPKQLLNAARALELGPEQLRNLMYEIPYSSNGKKRHVDPCPLSSRELDVLKKLAEGKVYKQIAGELDCPPARCAPTCTTPTPSSEPAIALRRYCWPPTAAGSSATAGSAAPPPAAPAASIRTSRGVPIRPLTKRLVELVGDRVENACHRVQASASRPRSARNQQSHISAYSPKWPTCAARSPTMRGARCRSACAEKAKISAISATGGPQRDNRRRGFDMTVPVDCAGCWRSRPRPRTPCAP